MKIPEVDPQSSPAENKPFLLTKNLTFAGINACTLDEPLASIMALDNVIMSSPHRRSQSQTAFSSPALKRQQLSRAEGSESCSTLIQRHRFLLTVLALLAFLCGIYLYFAVTLGSSDECSTLTGAQKVSCQLQWAKASAANRKLKFVWQP